MPEHVAIIMDGNGRWAKKRLLNRIKGHEKGSETVRSIVRAGRKIGIKYLTLYAFSTENWQRPKAEVKALMHLLERFLKKELQEMQDNNIRLFTIGQQEKLPEKVRARLQKTMALTEKNNGMQLNLALSYGGRAEIVRMVRSVAKQAVSGEIAMDAINEDVVARNLHTADMPDPELLIRTSGEMRISNFLLWQIAYSEIFITDTLWPDFSQEEFFNILKEFQNRDRRFGKTNT
ncbi:MAG: isoprenyl transferase [Deltaproteobacteria bacterium]|nr:isoprenyl transferase [Deltaproteobacteria bacterium]